MRSSQLATSECACCILGVSSILASFGLYSTSGAYFVYKRFPPPLLAQQTCHDFCDYEQRAHKRNCNRVIRQTFLTSANCFCWLIRARRRPLTPFIGRGRGRELISVSIRSPRDYPTRVIRDVSMQKPVLETTVSASSTSRRKLAPNTCVYERLLDVNGIIYLIQIFTAQCLRGKV